MVTDLSLFSTLNRDFDRLMDVFSTPAFYSQRRQSYPPLNISEDEHNIYVQCEVPGIDMKDIEIVLAESSLSVKGERKATEGKYYRQERPMGLFQRVVRINAPVDVEAIKARLKDGVLEVTLPKAEEAKPKKIAIES